MPNKKFYYSFIVLSFIVNLISPTFSFSQEIDLKLPAPSKIKPISKVYAPAMIKAVTVNPKDPFLFDFIIDRGDSDLSDEAFEIETQKLVKYFLAALTIPESDLWVNLSPYEKDAMVPQVLGVTELGKDLLIEDYYLKQVTAAMTNPNTPTGKKFWSLAYAKAQELYGTKQVPINTFSKVWIVPDQANVLEKDGSAFIADSHLKVFLDQDYLAITKNLDNKDIGTDKLGTAKTQDINSFSSAIIRDVVLPEIEKEVNQGENFATVRQIYSSAILAAWYKKRLKESLLGKLYADQNKVAGVNAADMDSGDKIFEKYTAALKTGAYNIIKQDFDLSTQKILQRKYFSGGVKMAPTASTAINQWTPQAVQNLSPATQLAVSSAVQSIQRASSGVTGRGNNSAKFFVARVSLSDVSASSPIGESVAQRINRFSTSGEATVELDPVQYYNDRFAILEGGASSTPSASKSLPPEPKSNIIPLRGNSAPERQSVPVTIAGKPSSLNLSVVNGNSDAPSTDNDREVFYGLLNANSDNMPAMLSSANSDLRRRVEAAKLALDDLARRKPESVRSLAAAQAEIPEIVSVLKGIRNTSPNIMEALQSEAQGRSTVNGIAALAQMNQLAAIDSAISEFNGLPGNADSQISDGDSLKLRQAIPLLKPRIEESPRESELLKSHPVIRLSTENSVLRDVVSVLERNPALGNFLAQKQTIPTEVKQSLNSDLAALRLIVTIDPAQVENRLIGSGVNLSLAEMETVTQEIKAVQSGGLTAPSQIAQRAPFVTERIAADPNFRDFLQKSASSSVNVTPAEWDAARIQLANSDYLMSVLSGQISGNGARILMSAIQAAVNDSQVRTMLDFTEQLRDILRANNLPQSFGTDIVASVKDYTAFSDFLRTPSDQLKREILPFINLNDRDKEIIADRIIRNVKTIVVAVNNPNQIVLPNRIAELPELERRVLRSAFNRLQVQQLTSATQRPQSTELDIVVATAPFSKLNTSIAMIDLPNNVQKSIVYTGKLSTQEVQGIITQLPADLQGQVSSVRRESGDIIATFYGGVLTVGSNTRAQDQFPVVVLSDNDLNQWRRTVQSPSERIFIAGLRGTAPLSDTQAVANEVASLADSLNITRSPEIVALSESVVSLKNQPSDYTFFEARMAVPLPVRTSLGRNNVAEAVFRRGQVAEIMNTIKASVSQEEQGSINWTNLEREVKSVINNPASRNQIANNAPNLSRFLQNAQINSKYERVISTSMERAAPKKPTVREALLNSGPEQSENIVKAFATQGNMTEGQAAEMLKGLKAVGVAIQQSDPRLNGKNVSVLTISEFRDVLKSVGGISEQTAAKYDRSIETKVGGIDLSAERMDLQIKRDGNGVVLPVSDQDLSNLKIDGLAPIVLGVEPATAASVPFLMNLSGGATGK